VQPAALQRAGGGLRLAPVAFHHHWPAHQYLAHFAAGQLMARRVGDDDLGAQTGAPDRVAAPQRSRLQPVQTAPAVSVNP
jgi:hypothetical protein